ncbi:hypothetical protein QQX98_010322 [Neonectria punicea]|uniref:Kelch repeat-containing protein n=1 Tax=Neonectria punicea TaxID=979145 RepID=A0ABR1GPT5_9HYPO
MFTRKLVTLSLSLLPLLYRQAACAPPPSHCTSTTGERWEILQPLGGGPRQEHAAVALDSKIYVIAGIEPDASQPTGVSTISSVEVYDVQQDTWSYAAPLPIPMNHANVATVNGKVYVLGGLSGGEAFRALPNSYEYNPSTDKWTELSPMPAGTERGSSILGVTGDTIIVAGGGVVGSNFYVVGGRFLGQVNVRDTVYALNLKTLRWRELARMPTPRGGVSVAIVGHRIYTFGGEGNLAPEAGFVFNETEVYDIKENCWQRLSPMNTPRHGMAAVTVNETIYTPGGGTRDFAVLDNMEAFHPGCLGGF